MNQLWKFSKSDFEWVKESCNGGLTCNKTLVKPEPLLAMDACCLLLSIGKDVIIGMSVTRNYPQLTRVGSVLPC